MAPLRLKAPHHMEDICWKLLLRLLLSSQRFTLGQHEWEQRPPVGVKQQVGLQRRWDEGSSGFGSAELRSPKEAGVAWGGGWGEGDVHRPQRRPSPRISNHLPALPLCWQTGPSCQAEQTPQPRDHQPIRSRGGSSALGHTVQGTTLIKVLPKCFNSRRTWSLIQAKEESLKDDGRDSDRCSTTTRLEVTSSPLGSHRPRPGDRPHSAKRQYGI